VLPSLYGAARKRASSALDAPVAPTAPENAAVAVAIAAVAAQTINHNKKRPFGRFYYLLYRPGISRALTSATYNAGTRIKCAAIPGTDSTK
jgi:hypothetical protein